MGVAVINTGGGSKVGWGVITGMNGVGVGVKGVAVGVRVGTAVTVTTGVGVGTLGSPAKVSKRLSLVDCVAPALSPRITCHSMLPPHDQSLLAGKRNP